MIVMGNRQNVIFYIDTVMEILKLPTHVAKFPTALIKQILLFPSEPNMCSQQRDKSLQTEGVQHRLDHFPARWPLVQSLAVDA